MWGGGGGGANQWPVIFASANHRRAKPPKSLNPSFAHRRFSTPDIFLRKNKVSNFFRYSQVTPTLFDTSFSSEDGDTQVISKGVITGTKLDVLFPLETATSSALSYHAKGDELFTELPKGNCLIYSEPTTSLMNFCRFFMFPRKTNFRSPEVCERFLLTGNHLTHILKFNCNSSRVLKLKAILAIDF